MEMQPEQLVRPRVAALDEILGVPFKVLDDGMVRVVDYMGNDAAIVQAARVSYGAGTKTEIRRQRTHSLPSCSTATLRRSRCAN
jgi:thymidylate synthase ThyX